jgi:hypothetical protein
LTTDPNLCWLLRIVAGWLISPIKNTLITKNTIT